MIKPILLSGSGEVSHLNHFSRTSGSINRGNGRIRTRHRVMFRVNGTPPMIGGACVHRRTRSITHQLPFQEVQI